MMKKNLLIFSLLLFTYVTIAQVYQWRGPDRNGIIPGTGLLKKWPDKGPELIWSLKGLGEGHSSIGPGKDCFFITGSEGNTGILFAFDYNGKLLWKKRYGTEWTENYPGPRSTPVVIDNLVYFQSGPGVVYCVNALTKEIEWSVDLQKQYGGRIVTWGMVENLLIEGDRIFCTPGGIKNNIIALNRLTGELIWTSPANKKPSAYCSSIYVRHEKSELIVTITDGSIVGVDAKTGEPYWNYPQNQGNHIHANAPVYSGGIIYCASEEADSDDGLVALKLSSDGKKVTALWRNRTFRNLMEGFIIRDNLIFGSVYEAGKWVCLDSKDGKILHSYSGFGDGVILWADGLYYCYSKRGEVALMEADRNSYKIISRFRISLGDGPHFSHPVILNGRMYIRHGSALMAYRISP
jgi:outer membrane protein assembly factor BamB